MEIGLSTQQKAYLYSCMVSIPEERRDSPETELILWQPIVINRQPDQQIADNQEFERWLTLSLDHLSRYNRPFSLAVLQITSQLPIINAELIELLSVTPQAITKKLAACCEQTIIATQLYDGHLLLLFPHCDKQQAESRLTQLCRQIRQLSPFFNGIVIQSVLQTYRERLQTCHEPVLQYQLVAKLQIELKQKCWRESQCCH